MITDVFFNEHSALKEYGLRFSKIEIGLPTARRTVVTVPGANGALDLTSAISNYTLYDEREIIITFYAVDSKQRWADIWARVVGLLHGQKMHIITDDDADWYWDAYCEVDSVESRKMVGLIAVKCTAFPYKKKVLKTTVSKTLTTGTNTINLANNRMEAIVKITNTAAITITEWNGTAVSIALAAGTHTLPDHVLESGANVIKMTGTGTVTIEYQEGKL